MNQDEPAGQQLVERVLQLERRVEELDHEASVSEQKHRDVNQRLRMEHFLAEMGTALLELTIDQVDAGIADWLGRIGDLIDTDRVTLFRHYSQDRCFRSTQSWERPGILPPRSVIDYDQTPWAVREILAGRIVRAERLEELPPEASTDVAFFEEHGNRGGLMIPLKARGSIIGAAVLASVRSERQWPEELVQWLHVAAQMFANLLVRLETETELAETKSLLLAAIEQSPAGILIADAPDVRIRLANSAALSIRGQSDQLLTEIPVEAHPSHWQTFREDGTMFEPEELPLSRAVLKSETSQNVVMRIRRDDGHDRWVLANAAPVRDAHGEVVAGVVVFPDVTDGIQAHEALVSSEEKYRVLFESADDAIVTMDGLKFVQCNERTLTMFGCDKLDEIVGHSPMDFSPPMQPDGQPSERKARKLLEAAYGGEPQLFYWQHIKPDGVTFDAEVSLNVFTIEGRDLLLAIVRDVTERLQMEESIRQSEEKFKQAFRSSPDSITISRLSDGCYLDVNEGFERLTGYKREDVVGKLSTDMAMWVDPKDRERMKEALEKSGYVTDMEIPFANPAGELRDCLLSAGVIELNGEACLVATVRDITEQKRAGEELEDSLRTKAGIVESISSGLFTYMYEPPDRLILLDGNPAAEQQTGIKVNEWIGKEFNEIWPEAKERGISDSFLSVMKTGQTYETEDTYYRDERLEGAFKITVFRMSETMLGVAFENITERKKAEETLRENEETLRALLNAPTETAILVDLEGSILAINEIGAKRLGKSVKEMIGLGLWAYLPDEVVTSRKAKGDEVVRTGQSVRFQDERAGRTYDNNIYPVFNDEGRVKALAIYARDITEQTQATQKLKIAEEFTRTAIDAQMDTFFVFEPETGKPIRWNKAFSEVSGYSDDEILTMKAPDDWYSKEELAGAAVALGKVASEGHATVEMSLITKDGRRIPTEYRASMMSDEHGNPKYVISIGRDITERKQVEEEVQKLAEVVKHSSELVNLATPDGQMIFLNQAGGSMLGIEPEEVESTNIMEVIPDHLKEMVKNEVVAALLMGKTWEGELQYRNIKTNEITDVHAMTFVVKDPSTGALVYLANVSRDITERKQTVEALSLSEQRLELAHGAAGMGMFDWDIENDLAVCNERYFGLFGLKPQERMLSEEDWLVSVHPDDRERAQTEVRETLGKKAPYNTEYRIIWPDGSVKWVSSIAKLVVNDKGQPIRMIGAMTDITERKRDEEALAARLRLESLLAELSADLVKTDPTEIDATVTKWLPHIIQYAGADRCSMWLPAQDGSDHRAEYRFTKPDFDQRYEAVSGDFPWMAQQLTSGDPIVIERLDDLPGEANADKAALKKYGVKSNISVALEGSGVLIGTLSLSTLEKERSWPNDLPRQIRLIGEVMANAIMRKRAEGALRESQERYRRL
ncbi:MAG: PAS domain S-box protein, partial [candidate division Zixibacteria bacterium]|nr:PAS domain S-box protein [candidate division Zixibacteria bacterium]